MQNTDCAAPVRVEKIVRRFGSHHVHHGGVEDRPTLDGWFFPFSL